MTTIWIGAETASAEEAPMPTEQTATLEQDFETWYRTNAPSVLRTVIAATGDRQLSEEAVAEAFAKAFARWAHVRTLESPTGWVVRVAHNHVRGRWRRLATERRHAPTDARPDVTHDIVRDTDLWHAVEALPERMRWVVILRYLEDLPEAEIARIVGVRRGTVASTLNAARTRLAEHLGEHS